MNVKMRPNIMEYCPKCGKDLVMKWDSVEGGYKGICPWCGGKERAVLYGSERLENLFTGIELSSAHVLPSTMRKLEEWEGDSDAPLTCKQIDSLGHSVLILAFSGDTEDEEIPAELRAIIKEAWERDWRVIMFDCDGQECGLFPTFWDEWNKEGQ